MRRHSEVDKTTIVPASAGLVKVKVSARVRDVPLSYNTNIFIEAHGADPHHI